MTKAVITVGKPTRDDGDDTVKLTLHPRVTNYAAVANAIERFFGDRAVFKTLRHASGSDTWEAVLVPGTKLEGLHDALAGGLNTRADLPANVAAVPEGAIPAFEDDDDVDDPVAERLLRTLLRELKGVREDANVLEQKSTALEAAEAELNAGVAALHKRLDGLTEIVEVALGEREV